MQLQIFQFGKIKNHNYSELVEYYQKLSRKAPKSLNVDAVQLKDLNPGGKIDPGKFLELQKLKAAQTFFLAEWGREYTSRQFFELLEKHYVQADDINLVIGNACSCMS